MSLSSQIVAVCICIDYSDFLAETLPHNRPLFTNYYIITESRDTKTIELAKAYDCEVIITTKTKEKGATFNKGGLIYDAQHLIHPTFPTAWIVKLDADIYLPSNLWESINLNSLNKNGIYGLIRHVYKSRDDYEKKNASSIDHNKDGVTGYFQLYWNKMKYYPEWSANCSRCDLTFMSKFSIKHTFPVACIHFGEKHSNWNGRVSSTW